MFTIDPDTARVSIRIKFCDHVHMCHTYSLQDLDDALHVKQLGEGTVPYRVYYVQSGLNVLLLCRDF